MKRRGSEQILLDVLESLEWGMEHFDGYIPRGGTEKKYVLKAVDMGLAESIGVVYQGDGDGGIYENRVMKEAWKLTVKGKKHLDKFRWDNFGIGVLKKDTVIGYTSGITLDDKGRG